MIALHPGAVQEIARAAVAPFFDATLAERCAQIADEWETDAQSVLNDDSGYGVACVIARAAHIRLAKAVADYHATIARARARLPALDAEVLAPEADIAMADQPDPLFRSDDDFIEASRRLKAFKKLRE